MNGVLNGHRDASELPVLILKHEESRVRDSCDLSARSATNRFIRLCQDLGIEGVRLHDLRHYVATSLGAAGTPIATISTRLGHRDRATTLNVYSHSLPALDQQAADVIGGLLDGNLGSD